MLLDHAAEGGNARGNVVESVNLDRLGAALYLRMDARQRFLGRAETSGRKHSRALCRRRERAEFRNWE